MSDDWFPVPDRRKPNLPYQAGLECLIQPHVPPGPFGRKYQKSSYPREIAPREELWDETASSWCLSHPPLDTDAVPHAETRTLKVTDQIACKDGRGAQLVGCILDGNYDQKFVAKIYDPLYYSFVSKEWGLPVDVTYSADQDYSCEAAAYQQFERSGVDGTLVPKHYGSWTFTMSLHKEPDVQRSVRMILLEWVPGRSMHSIFKSPDFARISPQHRLDILAAVLEVYCMVNFHKIHHGDFAPRNVLLVGSDVDIQIPEVKLIDFNLSAVYTEPNARHRGFDDRLPRSPRLVFWSGCPVEFRAWCPPPHRDKKEVFRGWLKKRWDGVEGFATELPEGLTVFDDYDEPVEQADPVEDREYFMMLRDLRQS